MPEASLSTDVVPTETLLDWAATVIGGPIADWHRISGGNRYQSFSLVARRSDGGEANYYLRYQMPRSASVEHYGVLREVEYYRLLEDSGVPAARLVAVNPAFPAILLEHVEGIAEYRRLTDREERETIAFEFTDALARLHQLRIDLSTLPDARGIRSMADCARREIADWGAMYEETGLRDPLIDLALRWLTANVPEVDEQPIFAHGDAGPGNFLFDKGHLKALIDWEFAHAGDPHDDLGWFAMRCVMEPVPDFAACLRRYEAATGRMVDAPRLRFYQVLVSTRVLIIRHRNVSGEHGNSIVSRALNRRLVTTALAMATGFTLPDEAPLDTPPTQQTDLYDFVIAGLRDDIVGRSEDRRVVAAAKNIAKIVKFLRETDRYRPVIEERRRAALTRILGYAVEDAEQAQLDMVEGVARGEIRFESALQYFAEAARGDAVLAASASGRIAGRSWPAIE